ncbi:MAG TPA: Rieske (2Fe-2S) protein [Polyangia bacterium]
MDRERRLICKATIALGAATLIPACGNGSNKMTDTCSSASTAVGNASGVPVDTGVNFPTAEAKVGMSIFICHDADGFFAVDAGCTHLGCDVALKDPTDLKQGFSCPCHGSTYDSNGENPTLPAPAGLTHYLVCGEASGELVVDLATEVDPKTRFNP